MSEVNDDGVVVGGGPAEGEEVDLPKFPNPDMVHPDYLQTMPGHSAPASDVLPGAPEEADSNQESGTTEESGSGE